MKKDKLNRIGWSIGILAVLILLFNPVKVPVNESYVYGKLIVFFEILFASMFKDALFLLSQIVSPVVVSVISILEIRKNKSKVLDKVLGSLLFISYMISIIVLFLV